MRPRLDVNAVTHGSTSHQYRAGHRPSPGNLPGLVVRFRKQAPRARRGRTYQRPSFEGPPEPCRPPQANRQGLILPVTFDLMLGAAPSCRRPNAERCRDRHCSAIEPISNCSKIMRYAGGSPRSTTGAAAPPDHLESNGRLDDLLDRLGFTPSWLCRKPTRWSAN
jgi:hypothetical protein